MVLARTVLTPLSIVTLLITAVLSSCAPEQGSLDDAARAVAESVVAKEASELDSQSSGIRRLEDMAEIPAGQFLRGAGSLVSVDPFLIDRYETTTAEFARFVEATGYQTEAEEWGWALVFHPEPDPSGEEVRVPQAPWWLKVNNVSWRQPEGPGSTIQDNHPAVQVSWNDAQRYCAWRGGRLPTEAEWEFAALGGLSAASYPWGDEFAQNGEHHANTWQGEFPVEHDVEDGFEGLAPVGSFDANGYGLFDMAGNVWEWCADWYEPGYFDVSPVDNPKGPASGTERVLRGGSFMCALNYCEGYRLDNRNHSAPDSGLNHTGVRCAASAKG